jgi:hypothetical protein
LFIKRKRKFGKLVVLADVLSHSCALGRGFDESVTEDIPQRTEEEFDAKPGDRPTASKEKNMQRHESERRIQKQHRFQKGPKWTCCNLYK